MTPTKDKKALVAGLADAVVALSSRADATRFLTDLCTPVELNALAERWHVARLLDQGELTYREIGLATGVSTTTITRVARFLKQESNLGYRALIDAMKERAR